MWKTFPIPLKFKVYIFDVQNPNEVQQGAIPIVREKGPYVYEYGIHKFLIFYVLICNIIIVNIVTKNK